MKVFTLSGNKIRKSGAAIYLFFSFSFVFGMTAYNIPSGQPQQSESKVEVGKLTQGFFSSMKWSYPSWITKNEEGQLENTSGESVDEKKLQKLEHTAQCTSSLQFNHEVRFCEAQLQSDGSIEIFIHDDSASTMDSLLIRIKDGTYSSQYWTTYFGDPSQDQLIWTTTKQRLILDKKQYKRGDMIKGQLDFECAEKNSSPEFKNSETVQIKLSGLIKPVLK